MKVQVTKNGKFYRMLEVTTTDCGYIMTNQGRFFLNSYLINLSGMTNDEATTVVMKGEKAVLSHPILSNCICHLGKNEGGLVIEDYEKVKEREERDRQERIRNGEQAVTVRFGFFGIRIDDRLDKATLNTIRPLATYIEGNDDDLEFLDDQGYWNVTKKEVQGWYYKNEVIEALNNAGIVTKYCGVTVRTIDEMKEVQKKKTEEKEKADAEKRIEDEKRSGIIREFNSLEKVYCSKEDVEKALKLEEIYIPELGFEGDDIYGGGKWLMQDDENIYYAVNNGRDGDDWSRNNFPTGGAGAILYKIEKNAISLSILEKMMAYCPEKKQGDPVQKCLEFFKSKDVLPKELDLSSCSSFSGKALYVRIADKVWLGMTPEKDKVVLLTEGHSFFDNGLSYFNGNFYSALAFNFCESLYNKWLAALPEWARKAWNKEPIQQGRFFVKSYVVPDNNYALFYCYKHNFGITDVDYSRNVEIVFVDHPDGHGTSIWSDGRILTETMVCFNVTGKKHGNIEDENWLQPFVWDYDKKCKQVSDVAKKLLRADCYGFDKSILVNAASYNSVEEIVGNKNISVKRVEVGFSDGSSQIFFEVYGCFASYDDVTEIFALHADKETALKEYNTYQD